MKGKREDKTVKKGGDAERKKRTNEEQMQKRTRIQNERNE